MFRREPIHHSLPEIPFVLLVCLLTGYFLGVFAPLFPSPLLTERTPMPRTVQAAAVGRVVHLYMRGATEPKAAVISYVHQPTDEQGVAVVDLHVMTRDEIDPVFVDEATALYPTREDALAANAEWFAVWPPHVPAITIPDAPVASGS